MSEQRGEEPPVTSFGTGGMVYDAARDASPWSRRKSLVVVAVGVVIAVLGLLTRYWQVVALSVPVVLLGLWWFWGQYRSDRDAAGLEAKARQQIADEQSGNPPA